MNTRTLLTCILAAATAVSGANWTTFHGNNQRTGRTAASVPSNPVVKWTYNFGGQVIGSPVIAPNGDVFIGPVWQDSLQPRQYFYAIKPDGTLRWRFETPWIDSQVIGTPAIGPDGRIYFGTATGQFYCLEPDGSVAWTYQAAKPIQTQVLVTKDGVYAAMDGMMRALSFEGALRWELPMTPTSIGGATETLQGNIVFYSANGTTCTTPSGTTLWNSSFAQGGLSAPVIAPSGDVIACGQMITWLHPETGAMRYFLNPFMDVTYGSPTVDGNGNVYHIAGYEAYKFSSTGQIVYNELLRDPGSNFLGHCWSSAAIDGGGRLYFGMGNGFRSAIQFEKNLNIRVLSMSQVMLLPLPHIAGTSSPAIAPDGTLYIGCLDGKLYAIGN